MTSDYCIDCGEHVENCKCGGGTYDMDNTPLDEIFGVEGNNRRSDWEPDLYENRLEYLRMIQDMDDTFNASGLSSQYQSFYEIDSDLIGQCEFCGTVQPAEQGAFTCAFCHQTSRTLPPVCKKGEDCGQS